MVIIFLLSYIAYYKCISSAANCGDASGGGGGNEAMTSTTLQPKLQPMVSKLLKIRGLTVIFIMKIHNKVSHFADQSSSNIPLFQWTGRIH